MLENSVTNKEKAPYNILFFDGICTLCSKYINFFISRDKKNNLRYAPLQGSTAKSLLKTEDIDNLSTIIYLSGNRLYKQSDAAIRSLASIGGVWKIVLIFLLVPKFIRDKIYSYISINRYSWFGKKAICRSATPEDNDKILP